MPKTLLAVDDSATMRKVLEITFAGEDFRVITAESPSSALQKMSEEPVAVVIDASLADGGDGYALAKDLRSRDARAVIVILSSRYAPYDANRGKDAGVDDFIDKPFDSQAMIDKVKKALVARETGKVAAPVAAPVVNLPATSPAPPPVAPPAAPAMPAFTVPRPPVGAPAGARPNFPTQRTHTLSFEGSASGPSAVASPPATQPMLPLSRTAPSGVPVVHVPPAAATAPPQAFSPQAPPPPLQSAPPVQASPPLHAPPPVLSAPGRTPDPAVARRAPDAPAVAAAVNGHLAGKLGDLGLTAGQVEAVLALSREVVERVVWEVVPQLAEAIIKEEILRITKDG